MPGPPQLERLGALVQGGGLLAACAGHVAHLEREEWTNWLENLYQKVEEAIDKLTTVSSKEKAESA